LNQQQQQQQQQHKGEKISIKFTTAAVDATETRKQSTTVRV
jgi:hypothetical protein